MGWFEPTPEGELLMPVLTRLGRFHDALSAVRAARAEGNDAAAVSARFAALSCDARRHRLASEAGNGVEALELELRDERGQRIPAQDVAIQDTESLLALAEEPGADLDDWDPGAETTMRELDEFDAALAELGMLDVSRPEDDAADTEPGPAEPLDEPDLPRYQILVNLVNAADVPIADRWMHDPDVMAMRDEIERASDGDRPPP